MTNSSFRFIMLFLMVFASTIHMVGQARLIIYNNSARMMTVKVMQDQLNSDFLHETVYIDPYGSKTIYFSETGNYYAKTKASLKGRDPVYRKGDPFSVYNGRDGYSVLELTFTIQETTLPQVTGGREISKAEFEKDN